MSMILRGSVLRFVFVAAIVLASSLQADSLYVGYSDFQIITDVRFRYQRYFALMKNHGVNFQRIWALGYSGAAPGVQERMPFDRRRGKYDLERINPEYLDHMKQVLQSANSNG